jgi:sodium/pantothenate symporter
MGFEISVSAVRTIVAVLILYYIIIVGFGFYSKYASRHENASQQFKSFLTGGDAIGPLSMAMMTFTAMSTAGSAVGGPGFGYSLGFTFSICVWTGFVYGAMIPFAIGKKMTIMRERIHATSLISLLRHRYGGSKHYSVLLALILVIFLSAQVVAQFSGGGKVFSVITGTGNYNIGILLFGIVTLIYAISGGIKSIARVAVIQGFIMIITVFVLYIGVLTGVSNQYGSISDATRWLAENKPNLVSAYGMTPFYNIGMSLIMCWGSTALPGGLVSAMSYKGSKAILKVGIISMLCTSIYQFTMSGLGPFTYSLNSGLTDVDYTSIYAATTVLPDVMSGLFVAGIASAVQSTVAALAVIVTGSIVVDVYKNLMAPDAPVEKLNRMNNIVIVIFSLACILISLRPAAMIQMIINFASGGLFSSLFFPLLLGFYSKRANRASGFFGSLFGLIGFMACYLLSANPVTRPAWIAFTFNCHPIVLGMAISLITMLICMKVAPKEEKGRLQVWFCRDYDESWADVTR